MWQKKTILLVDDEPITLQGLKKTLESWANDTYEILTASDANTALNIIKSKKVHIVITDISMPVMSGLEMLKNIKANHSFPVVIIISAYSDFKYAQEAIEIGVVNYLLKPIKKDKLIEEVEKAFALEEKRYRVNMMEKIVDEQMIELKVDDQMTDGPINRAIEYIHLNLNQQLSLKDVASHIHLNASYFSVFFKEQTNMTFSEYVTRCRIQKAKKLLLTTDYTVAEIAEQVGYNTSKYFITIFKEHEGVTPSTYKKKE